MTEVTQQWGASSTRDALFRDSLLLFWIRISAAGGHRLAVLLGLPRPGGR